MIAVSEAKEQDEDRVSLPASCPRLAVSKKEGCREGKEAVTKLSSVAPPARIRVGLSYSHFGAAWGLFTSGRRREFSNVIEWFWNPVSTESVAVALYLTRRQDLFA